jgi:hypothetical protein
MAARDHLIPLSLFIVLASGLAVRRATTHPSLRRDWQPAQAELAAVHIFGDDVRIDNIRNADHRAGTDRTISTFSRSFQLSGLKRAWLVLERQGRGKAHAMISFEFEGPEYVVMSPEPRCENGESFSAVLGFFRRYELAYIVATERDAIGLGAVVRRNPVYLYEMNLSGEKVRRLFEGMSGRASKLAAEPEFYHTLFNSVTGNLLRHLRPLADRPSAGPILFSSRFDTRLYEMRLLRTDGSIEFLRGRGLVTPLAGECAEKEDFSDCIRKNLMQLGEGF